MLAKKVGLGTAPEGIAPGPDGVYSAVSVGCVHCQGVGVIEGEEDICTDGEGDAEHNILKVLLGRGLLMRRRRM